MLETLLAMTLTVSVGSHHWVNEDENGRNPGLGLQGERWAAGYYLNSKREDSFYIGAAFERATAWGDYGVIVGAVTGYDKATWDHTYNGVTPLVAPYVSVGNVRLIQIGDATGLQFVFPFGE